MKCCKQQDNLTTIKNIIKSLCKVVSFLNADLEQLK